MTEAPGLHEPTESDTERGWRGGRIFRCQACAEEVIVEERTPSEGQPGA